jgi:hypothetical protein
MPKDERLSELTKENWLEFRTYGDFPILPRTSPGDEEDDEYSPQDSVHLNVEPTFGRSSNVFVKRNLGGGAKPVPGSHAKPTAGLDDGHAEGTPGPSAASDREVVSDIRDLCDTLDRIQNAMSTALSSMAETLTKPSPIRPTMERNDMVSKVRFAVASAGLS